MELRATQVLPWTPTYALESLAFLCQDRDFLRCFAQHIKPEYYRNDVHKVICTGILYWWDKHRALPNKDTLLESLHRLKTQGDIKGHRVPQLEDEEFYTEVKEKAKKIATWNLAGETGHLRDSYLTFIQHRAVELAAIKIQTELLPAGKMADVAKLMKDATSVGAATEEAPRDVGDPDEVRARHAWRNELGSIKTPTGIPSLDERMGGGLGPEELGVIMAGPSRGKTTGLIQFAVNAILIGRRNVFYVSREQSFEKLGTKLDSCLMGLTRQELQKKPKSTRTRWEDLYRDTQAKIKLKKYKKPCTADEILADIRLLETRDGFKTDLLMIDYADKMRPITQRKADSNYDMQGDIYQDVFDLCAELKIPCWTASQSNRQALNKDRIDLDDFGDSFKKSHIADVVLCFCQSHAEYKMGNPAKGIPSQARLFLGKNRDNEARQQEIVIDAFYAISTWKVKEVRDVLERAKDEDEDGKES